MDHSGGEAERGFERGAGTWGEVNNREGDVRLSGILSAAEKSDEQIEALYGKELRKVKDRVVRWRMMQAREAFHIGDLWKQLEEELPRASIAAFLSSECQIPRRDVARYAKLVDNLGSERNVLIERGVALSVMLDLASQSEHVREEAMAMIRRGRSLQTKELAGLKRDLGLARMAKEGLLDVRRARDFKNAAARKARATAGEWLATLETAANELIALSELDYNELIAPEGVRRVRELGEGAGKLLQELPFIAGTDFIQERPHRVLGASWDSWKTVERALGRLSRRDIFADDDYPRRPTPPHRIDPDLIWDLAWAFGYDRDSRPETLTTTMRAEGQTPLDATPEEGRIQAERVRSLNVLEICAGAGGQALGLHAAGFHHVGLIEVNEDAVATMMANRPDWPVIQADLREINLEEYEGVDLLAGGVPCQPYSAAGERRGAEDERDLFPEALELVRELKPRAVMLENVTGALDAPNSLNRLRILAKLTSLGYDAEWRILEGLEFGLSQKRRRAILVGFRPGIMHRFRWPNPLKAKPPTVGEALRDLMGADGWRHVDAWVKRANGFAPTLIGGSQKKLGIDLAQKKSRESWVKMGVDPNGRAKTAPGLDADENHTPKLTLKMIARLQDFPDHWEFAGPDLQIFHQIANAFPPCMARAIGASIMRALTGSEIDLEAALVTPIHRKGRLNLAALRSLEEPEPAYW